VSALTRTPVSEIRTLRACHGTGGSGPMRIGRLECAYEPANRRETKARAKLGERPKRKVPSAPDMRPDSTISFRPYLSARCLHADRVALQTCVACARMSVVCVWVRVGRGMCVPEIEGRDKRCQAVRPDEGSRGHAHLLLGDTKPRSAHVCPHNQRGN
jgi:hypothetical protein